jgi:hypothetical protein
MDHTHTTNDYGTPSALTPGQKAVDDVLRIGGITMDTDFWKLMPDYPSRDDVFAAILRFGWVKNETEFIATYPDAALRALHQPSRSPVLEPPLTGVRPPPLTGVRPPPLTVVRQPPPTTVRQPPPTTVRPPPPTTSVSPPEGPPGPKTSMANRLSRKQSPNHVWHIVQTMKALRDSITREMQSNASIPGWKRLIITKGGEIEIPLGPITTDEFHQAIESVGLGIFQLAPVMTFLTSQPVNATQPVVTTMVVPQKKDHTSDYLAFTGALAEALNGLETESPERYIPQTRVMLVRPEGEQNVPSELLELIGMQLTIADILRAASLPDVWQRNKMLWEMLSVDDRIRVSMDYLHWGVARHMRAFSHSAHA